MKEHKKVKVFAYKVFINSVYSVLWEWIVHFNRTVYVCITRFVHVPLGFLWFEDNIYFCLRIWPDLSFLEERDKHKHIAVLGKCNKTCVQTASRGIKLIITFHIIRVQC